jgi:hypothetical protein
VCSETPAVEEYGVLRVPETLHTESQRYGLKIVRHDADLVHLRIVDIGQIAHADGKILRSSLIRNLHMAPGSVRIRAEYR